MCMGDLRRALLGAVGATAAAFLLAPAAQAVEPNDDFATATGPLTAGLALNASLETAEDADFQFFYIPDGATVTVKVKNRTTKKNATGGRTLVASLLQARKGKLPLPLAGTRRVISPQGVARIKRTLVPGKYFVPIGHSAPEKAAANVPFRIQIFPAGTTTDSYEIFAHRCRDALRKVRQFKRSKQHVVKRIAKARRKGKDRKVLQLRAKLRLKRGKIGEAQRIRRIVCSIPQ